MKLKPFNTMATAAVAMSLMLAGCSAGSSEKEKEEGKSSSPVTVKPTDYTFDTASNMFAYAEFELSGEPLVEGLGLDLDILDPKKVDQPAKFDYTAGIEAYEYSEEAMYEVVEKSGLGLHLLNGPVIQKAAKEEGKKPEEVLGERFYKLADSVGYPKEEIFSNMYPTMIEYAYGDPHYSQKVETGEYAPGEDGAYVPEYQVNFESLRWDRSRMEKLLTPAAYGGTFLKQALWAGDFMGGFHTVDKDEELAGETPKDDDDKNIRLGVSSADGMQGVILTEEIWNKLNYVHDSLFYQSAKGELGKAGLGSEYDPSKGFVYLPHATEVTEGGSEAAPNAESLNVTDKSSKLNDQWMMLWPSAEFFGMTDQRADNKNTPPSFRALFDGEPFAAAPKENTDNDPANDVVSDDAFSVNRDVMLHTFKNLDAMHFNNDEGTFVTEHDGKTQGTKVDAFEAGYTIESLRIFQRAIDGLPVGYASGEAAKGLETAEGKRALELIRKQADFMMNEMINDSGLVTESYTIGKGKEGNETLKAQLGAIRGLNAAFLATEDEKYRDAARKLYAAMDEKLWDKKAHAYETAKGEMKYDPATAGAVAAVYRVALNNLSNSSGDDAVKALDKETIVNRYTDFFDTVIDGPGLDEGMQTSEFWDTGDFYKKGDKSENTDGDNVPQIQAGHGKYGISPVLVPVEVKKK
ncbi:hypothetical protein ACFFJY_00855 [Fictibacillus aquaticus]|uniref:ABC transporter substrate-binding protein n=1 Tax=Fictibacillus aquaticus TaxID=2021314 RepID=A0A235F887_9BACL|nr:hypothetical protein [Fictibacillus aquaticus]OYD57274.1 hypothetical protein CGZ90_11335 [Fictibacillus aquaticus]